MPLSSCSLSSLAAALAARVLPCSQHRHFPVAHTAQATSLNFLGNPVPEPRWARLEPAACFNSRAWRHWSLGQVLHCCARPLPLDQPTHNWQPAELGSEACSIRTSWQDRGSEIVYVTHPSAAARNDLASPLAAAPSKWEGKSTRCLIIIQIKVINKTPDTGQQRPPTRLPEYFRAKAPRMVTVAISMTVLVSQQP